MRVAIVHDHLGFRGGGERTVLLLALHLKADFITAYARPDTFSEYQKELGKNLITLSQRIIKIRVVRFFWLRYQFFRYRRRFRQYDLLIASGQTATEAVASYARPECTKIVYTHSTPRRVFDQYKISKKMYPFFLRPAYALFARFWKWLYLKSIRKFDINIANSENVRTRIKDHTGSNANAVIWPPILTNEFKWLGQEDYFFSWARVDEAKRVELIVKAFKKMPEEKLIVASGGPRLAAVKKLAKGAPNITILGWMTEKKLKELAGKCRAAVYIPMDEDAGITHLEANAAGKPFLGVREGGLIESTLENQTGILIRPNPGEKDIILAAKTMTRQWCLERREICESHAKKYDASIFLKRMEKIIKENDPSIPVLGIDASRYEDPRFPGKGKRTGVEVYAKSLIDNLISAAREKSVRLRLYAPYPLKELPDEIQKVIPAESEWTRKALARELKSSPPKYFFTPAYYIPANAPKNSFATVHDVVFKSEPKKYSLSERLAQNYALGQNLKRAKKIITISGHSKNEIVRLCRVTPEKIIVVPMAYEPQKDIDRAQPRKKQIIFIGRIEKKKSIDILIRAFYEFRKTHDDWKLILAGKPGYGYDGTIKLIKEYALGDAVRLPGFISEEEKWRLLTESALFVHPSASEGSAIPLFEAWDAQTPAIASDIPVMREVAKQAASLFEKDNARDLFDKISELAANKSLQVFLNKKGNENLKSLSWKKAAEEVLKVILDERKKIIMAQ